MDAAPPLAKHALTKRLAWGDEMDEVGRHEHVGPCHYPWDLLGDDWDVWGDCWGRRP